MREISVALWNIWPTCYHGRGLTSFPPIGFWSQCPAPWVVVPVSLRCIQLGSRTAIYYFLAFGCFFIGSSAYSAKDLSWLPADFFTLNGTYFGSAAEMILLSLGLAARMKLLKEEKLKSELQTLEAERRLAESRKELEQQAALSALAAQVAHDIRSPLAALDCVMQDVSQLPEKRRNMMRSAAARIRDIANNLIEMNRTLQAVGNGVPAAGPALAMPDGVHLLSSLLDPLVTEKRVQFQSKTGVEIDARLDEASYGLFAEIQPAEFKRVLSNLINNGVEALADKGAVTVSLAREDGKILLTVHDNGKGIAAEVLPRLGRKGETHGKAGGSGLGLYHAKTCVEVWGGSLGIKSEPGQGTTVAIRLPQARPPAWFVSELEIKPGSTVVVFDDDPSIHQVWQGRFDALRSKEHGISVLDFETPEQLRGWVSGRAPSAGNVLFLMDYELRGHQDTGLSLAEELRIGERAILVTSRFEERRILEGCLRLKMRMIPKGMAGFVPVSVRS